MRSKSGLGSEKNQWDLLGNRGDLTLGSSGKKWDPKGL
jgi:hypothetical protein